MIWCKTSPGLCGTLARPQPGRVAIRPLTLPGEDAQEGPCRAQPGEHGRSHLYAPPPGEHPYFRTFTIGTPSPVGFSATACQPAGICGSIHLKSQAAST